MVYTDPRTGLQFENESIARSLGYGQPATPQAVIQPAITIQPSASSPGGLDTRLRDASGNLITNQIGSQFWMDASAVKNNQYSEFDPDLETKAKYSTATAAATWMTDYVDILVKNGVPVNSEVAKMADRPTSPILNLYGSAQSAYDQRYNTPAGSSAGSAMSPTSGSFVPTPASVAADPNTNTGSNTGAGVLSSLMGYSVYILIAVAAITAIVLWRSRK